MRIGSVLRASIALSCMLFALDASASGDVDGARGAPVVEFNRVWRYEHATGGVPGQKSEIVAHDERTDTLWVAGVVGVDVLDRATGQKRGHIDAAPYGAVNSVAIRDGLAAIAIEAAPDRSQPGVVLFVDTRSGARVGDPVTVGALPDMLTFTPSGHQILVANEGTPNPRVAGQACPFDPQGSVSIVDVHTRQVTTIPVNSAIPGYGELRLFPTTGGGALCPYDPEPEFIAVDPSGLRAYVGLQEANGVAVLNLWTRRFERIYGLGLKDFNLPGNSIDPNDRDGAIALQQAPVKGLYQPDSLATYEFRGRSFVVMANEGDARDNGAGDSEDERRGAAGGYVPSTSPLARLNMSNIESTPANLVSFGGRSFSIRDAQGRIVFDSGNRLDAEAIARGIYDDGRSDNKGVEPEGVALMRIEGRVLAFIGLERTTKSAVAIYDVTNPYEATFLDMIVSDGDISPEGLKALRVRNRNYLAVANEVTDTTSLFEIRLRRTGRDGSSHDGSNHDD